MPHDVLTRLREDHKCFERFFKAIEEKCARVESGIPINRARLKAIVAYLSKAFPPHHGLEDAVFARIAQAFPHFRKDIYDLSDDHQGSRREFHLLTHALEAGEDFIEPALSFVANERGHIISEEEIVFPYAAKHLPAEQWPASGEFPLYTDSILAEVELIKDLFA